MDEGYTNQIKILFGTLATLESHVSAKHGPGNIHLTVYTPTRYLCDSECYHRKFTSWRVRLLSPSTLPTLSSVRALTLEVPGGDISYPEEGGEFLCHIDNRVLPDIGRKCPNLDTLSCSLGGREWLGSFQSPAMNESCQDWAGRCRDSRHDFAKAMNGMEQAVPCLGHVQLDFLHPFYWPEAFDHRLAVPDLVKPALSDPFSSGIRALSHQLRTMDVRVVADEALFWPVGSISEECVWPNMQSIHVMFHNCHPSGSWYFGDKSNSTKGYEVMPKDYPPLEQTDRDRANDEDEDTEYVNWVTGDAFSRRHTRVFPHEASLVPFLKAFVRAAAFMPVLRQCLLWTPNTLDVGHLKEEFPRLDPKRISNYARENTCLDLGWGIAYTSPRAEHVLTWTGTYDGSTRNLWWKVGSWRPEPGLRQLFQVIGQKEHGTELHEHWDDITQENSLDYRDWFENWTPGRR